MPKPFADHPGSGMHTHVSLFEGDRNAFHEPGADYQLSKVGRSFIAGLLTHAPEITAVTNQWVNSYKRLGGGGEAPAYVCWGHNNRSALVRIPMYKPTKGNATRVEFRSIDTAANPYLAFAVMLAAGLKGVEKGYDLPPGAEDDVWSLTESERRALGIEPLPTSLGQAITVMERSELVAETLGEHVFDFFLRNKRAEWQEYRRQVTPVRARPLPPGALGRPCRPRPSRTRRCACSLSRTTRPTRPRSSVSGGRRSASRSSSCAPTPASRCPRRCPTGSTGSSCWAGRWPRGRTTALPGCPSCAPSWPTPSEAARRCSACCLGGQVMTLACGGVVDRAAVSEVGVYELDLEAAAAADPLFSLLPDKVPVAQYHGDAMLEMPEGAVLLASTHDCAVQGYRLGDRAWAVQFHPEVDAEIVGTWFADDPAPVEKCGRTTEAVLDELVARAAEMRDAWRPFAHAFADVVRASR